MNGDQGQGIDAGAASGADWRAWWHHPACGLAGLMGYRHRPAAGRGLLWGDRPEDMLGADDSLDVFGVYGVAVSWRIAYRRVLSPSSLGGTGKG